ncbi:hypothetical protein EYB25_003394 [Talaromyces marneffei]|uniref:uncharacterized protein n=1 Tax=Talaromyces marneffei TaxID=37727 RepID=UPI0012A895EF|nr:uncharacterized protein EYB26_005872 [Talaromyces marneffei]KAE8554847.1 hypothetical protein EYB25_003394 [Talaromyces marneffei]QGA18188.1 hypothetical protein EYB26_005872 [Talaromyces marneffei]
MEDTTKVSRYRIGMYSLLSPDSTLLRVISRCTRPVPIRDDTVSLSAYYITMYIDSWKYSIGAIERKRCTDRSSS